MSKQINLLAQAQAAPALTALRALIGLGVMLAAFLGYAAIGWFGTARLGDTATQSNSQLAAEKVALRALEQKLGARPKLADIVAQIDALKAQAGESQEMLNLLRSGGGGSEGYSGQLTTLARISEDGVWLTGVKIGNAGKTVSLAGRSLRNESVLRYAQRLNEQFLAYGVQFSAVELTPDIAKEGAAAAAGPALPSVAFKLF
jgi:Tfp pilus assembly protein PilN